MVIKEECNNETSEDEAIVEVEFEGEIISDLEDLKKSRNKNKILKD